MGATVQQLLLRKPRLGELVHQIDLALVSSQHRLRSQGVLRIFPGDLAAADNGVIDHGKVVFVLNPQ